MALKSLVAVQTKPKIYTTRHITKILNYRTTHPDVLTEYKRTGMMLHIYLDASYISEPEARSRADRYFFLGPKFNTPIKSMPPHNGPVHVECRIMRNVMESSTEAELRGLFENCQKTTSMRTALEEMGQTHWRKRTI